MAFPRVPPRLHHWVGEEDRSVGELVAGFKNKVKDFVLEVVGDKAHRKLNTFDSQSFPSNFAHDLPCDSPCAASRRYHPQRGLGLSGPSS